MKLELGSGKNPRGAGYRTLDKVPPADFLCDLEREPIPLPDASVEALYSAHTLEHLAEPDKLLREIARVCRTGASVEIRTPHWLSPMALCSGHKSVVSEEQWQQWCVEFPDHWGTGSPRRLRLDRIEHVRSRDFDELRLLYLLWREDQILRFAPGAAHETRAFLTVVDYP